MLTSTLKHLKECWFVILVLLFWVIMNLCLCDRSISDELIKPASPDEILAYAEANYGKAALLSAEQTSGSIKCTLQDISLNFDYEVISEIRHSNDILPYYECKQSNFMQCYQQQLISIVSNKYKVLPSKYPGSKEMYVIAEDKDLADTAAKELKALDVRKLLGNIYLQSPSGEGYGCYQATPERFVSQEELDKQFFEYKFNLIIEYPYTYTYLGTQVVDLQDVPGVVMEDVYSYYESCSLPVPNSVTLYWFYIESLGNYFVADLKGMYGQNKYYTNFIF